MITNLELMLSIQVNWTLTQLLNDCTTLLGLTAVICCSTKGLLKVVDLNSGCVSSQMQLNGDVFSSPVFLDRKIVVGCRDDFVYCLHLTM